MEYPSRMRQNHSPLEAFKAAIAVAGSQSELARMCAVGQPTVWKWLNIKKQLPAEHVLKVEAATGVSRHELRPDLYPIEDASPVRDIPLRGSIGSCDKGSKLQVGE